MAQPPMDRLDKPLVDDVERPGRLLDLAQDELHEIRDPGAGDQEAGHALGREAELGFRRRRVGRDRQLLQDRVGDGADRRHDMLGAGVAELLLAAEMIGDGADIRPGLGRDLAGRGGGEALPAEQLQPGVDERRPRPFGGRRLLRGGARRRAGVVAFFHDRYLINRMIKIKSRSAVDAAPPVATFAAGRTSEEQA